MKSIILTAYLILVSTTVFSDNNLKTEKSIEVKVTSIDFKKYTISYLQDNKINILNIDPDIIEIGYYNNDGLPIDLKKMVLNKVYFLRVVNNDYINYDNKRVKEKYVSTISTIPYRQLF